MPEDRDTDHEPSRNSDLESDDQAAIEEDPTDALDLAHPERVHVGVTRGEYDLEIGPPRDYPDRADVSVRPEDEDEGEGEGEDEDEDDHRVVLSLDVMAGDHGTGHADVELTPAEARTLRDRLDETVRWMDGSDADDGE
ncbi:hypothetical protein [Halopiger xanaduensis]|uniref:Uncharacterized protein n=1 Tax=Halopiger xanaduensis (strain DSM 18323 / JCM 14033 / SH-6) TaxID=797210 RepID=F8DCF6_HALXS|nr:hypothetical protein [Halopiger xanaduensis]AEH38417.1 hypothetical protein Halxa_3811 [Halopiger xanaduensis SH-6]